MSVSEFVQQGWADHGKDAEGVFARFPDGVGMAAVAADAPQLASLIVHVAGEHLGRWAEGLRLVSGLASAPFVEAGTPEAASLQRSMAILHLCAGDTPAFEVCLSAGRSGADVPPESDRIRVLAVAGSALAGQQRTGEAQSMFEEAVRLADYGPSKDDPAARALAITGNNLASELEEKTDRSDAETSLMKQAAAIGRRYWEIAGTWVNVERAEYRLARTHLAAAEPADALEHARACLDVCRSNDADAGELFFAHEVLARAHHAAGEAADARSARDAAAALVGDVDPSWTDMCRAELTKLDTTLTG